MSTFPSDYQGQPFADEVYQGGPQVIPGRVECAYYDQGGEGVAYHDTTPINKGSGEYNMKPEQQRPHATPYLWHFRVHEGVDISYVKDTMDLSHHENLVEPPLNQLFIGWAADGEWCNYTVDVKKAGRYRITALYSQNASAFKFSVDGVHASDCQFPVATGTPHKWNRAVVGEIAFATAGRHLLTLNYNKGNNYAYFDFELMEEAK